VTTTLEDKATLPAPRLSGPPVVTGNRVLAIIGVGALAAIGLWWNDTPPLRGLGEWVTNAGRVTGLLAGYGVVILLALMARIPSLEHTIGADRLARWHAMGGRYTVSLVVAHATLITWGYSITGHTTSCTRPRRYCSAWIHRRINAVWHVVGRGCPAV